MKGGAITIARGDLLPALKPATSAVERRTTIPILANVLIDVAGGRMRLTGTDLDVEISAFAPCAGAREARFTIPATLFSDAVRKLPDGAEITIEADAQLATIAAGRARFKMPVLPADDFHELSAGDLPHSFELPAASLKRIIEAVRFAISTEETRYYLNGIHLHQDGERLVAVTTDGHRLSKIDLPLPEGAEGMPPIIIPRRTVDLVEKAMGDSKEPVSIALSDSKIRFANGDALTLTSKLIDGTFPDYKRVVPGRHPNRFTLECEALAAAVDRVVTISAGAKGSAVRFTFAGDGLTLSAEDSDIGTAEDHVAVENVEGDPVVIGFNGRYCLDMLAACPTPRITFLLGDPGEAARIEPEGHDDQLFLLMPMRV